VQNRIFNLKQRLISRYPASNNNMKTMAFCAWEQTPLGQHLIALEKQYCDRHLPKLSGFRAMELGVSQRFSLLDQLPHLHSFRLAASDLANDSNCSAISNFDALPLPSETVDVSVLHHVLEFSRRPHAALNEAARVLVPGGNLVLIGFNPWSLIGLEQWPALLFRGNNAFWHFQALSSARILDWLQLLGFQTHTLRFGGYELPLQSESLLRKMRFLELAGSKLNMPLGSFYLIGARKQVLKPIWKPQPLWLEPKIASFKTADKPVIKTSDRERLIA